MGLSPPMGLSVSAWGLVRVGMLIEVHAKALDTGILLAEDVVTKSFAE